MPAAREKVTANFYFDEFVTSPTASSKGIKNVPGFKESQALRYLIKNVLQPVRSHFKKPVHVHSGYRSPELNVAVGGSVSSQHCFGEAADFEIYGVANKEVADWIADNLVYDQVILEFYNPVSPEGINSGWVHVSVKANGKNRKSKLVAYKDGKKTVYKKVKNFSEV